MIVALNGESQWIFSSLYRKSVKTRIMEIILKDIHRVLQPEIVFKTLKFNTMNIFKFVVS
jgi:NADPH-dependent 7-cyano-7-deazaguanine reductase QueF